MPDASAIGDALTLQHAAAAEGFDWPKAPEGVASALWDKLHEEIAELRQAGSPAERKEEFGDLMFMLLNLARHLSIDPMPALDAANAKFSTRFAFVMGHRASFADLVGVERLEAMERLWQEAKRRERESPPFSQDVGANRF